MTIKPCPLCAEVVKSTKAVVAGHEAVTRDLTRVIEKLIPILRRREEGDEDLQLVRETLEVLLTTLRVAPPILPVVH